MPYSKDKRLTIFPIVDGQGQKALTNYICINLSMLLIW